MSVSEADFLRLPESSDKVELIDGEIFSAPTPTLKHQRAVSRLTAALVGWAEAHGAEAICSPVDVRFAPARILQPDVAVFLEPLDPNQSPIEVIPTLCVEVLSASSRSYDRVTKRFVYAAAGVREYWIVDPAGYVERWTGDQLAEGERVEDALQSPLLPGFHLPLPKLFR